MLTKGLGSSITSFKNVTYMGTFFEIVHIISWLCFQRVYFLHSCIHSLFLSCMLDTKGSSRRDISLTWHQSLTVINLQVRFVNETFIGLTLSAPVAVVEFTEWLHFLVCFRAQAFFVSSASILFAWEGEQMWDFTRSSAHAINSVTAPTNK